jgi:hypothetical protein
MSLHQSITLKHRIVFTVIIAVLIWGNLIWNYFNDGVPSHHILDNKDLPTISNWWGGIVVPVITWFLLLRIAKRVNNDSSPSNKLSTTIYNFLAAVVFGVLISYFFSIGSEVPSYLLMLAMLLSFFIPLFKAEFLLGFIVGMTYTFGGILPVAFGIIFIILFAIAYKVIRAGVLYLVSKMR